MICDFINTFRSRLSEMGCLVIDKPFEDTWSGGIHSSVVLSPLYCLFCQRVARSLRMSRLVCWFTTYTFQILCSEHSIKSLWYFFKWDTETTEWLNYRKWKCFPTWHVQLALPLWTLDRLSTVALQPELRSAVTLSFNTLPSYKLRVTALLSSGLGQL